MDALPMDRTNSMNINEETTFRGLPLTPEQNAEVLRYIEERNRDGEPWDTMRLDYMLKDMLEPPKPTRSR